MSINIEARYEELLETFVRDDLAVLEMASMIVKLEWHVEDLKADIEDLKKDLDYAEGRIGL